MNTDDFIFYRDDNNNICSGGYVINNILKKMDLPLLYSNKDPLQSGGGGSTILSDLVIPAGLVLIQQQASKDTFAAQKRSSPITEDLYSQLLKLVNVKKSIKTHKRRRTKKNKTRKNKIKK